VILYLRKDGEKMKVLITTLNSKYSHTNIALYYLKNSIKDICDTYTHNFTINDNLEKIVETIVNYNCDLVCLGCYIWNIEQTLKIAKSLKIIKPNVSIAFGGPEVSYNPDYYLKNYDFISSIICGEGENSIRQLVLDFKNNKIQKIYSIPVKSEDIPEITDDILDNYDNRVVYFETSRGCPFRCSYCLSCIDKNIKCFDLETVKKDLLKILEKDVKQIRFIDRTFNSNKKRALEIWDFLIKNRKSTTFHFEICANLIDAETLIFLRDVPNDIFQFEIGIQSTNENTLKSINRGYNFEYESKVIKKLVEFGNIKLHTDLIIGLPFEDINIFKKSFNDLYSLHTNEVQLGFLKFLKGTDIYTTKEEFEYKYNDYPPYELLENKFISYNEVRFLKKFEIVFDIFFNSGYFKNTIKFLEKKYTDYFTLFEEITKYFDQNNYFDRKISTDESYDILINMYREDIDFNVIKQSLTYDYFLKFNGYRDWFYNKYSENLKEIISKFIDKNREILFNNMTNSNIHKMFKFCILDFDFENNSESNMKIYMHNK
jgi:radical SAM superfamily enzyme YgiQ (UPF0313 family)